MPAWQITRTPLELQLRQPTFTAKEIASEIWRPIFGYEGHYEVSDLGRVKSLKNYHHFMPGLILKVSPEGKGYLKVTLSLQSALKTFKVHQLVAGAFVYGPCQPGQEVNHKDGYKTNNRAGNLEWSTKKLNMEHAAANGLTPRGDRHGLRKWKNAAARGDDHGLRKHPERVSRGDNHWTRRNKGAQRGERNNCAKVTTAMRRAMQRLYRKGGVSYKQLALQFNVSSQTAWNSVNRRQMLRDRRN